MNNASSRFSVANLVALISLAALALAFFALPWMTPVDAPATGVSLLPPTVTLFNEEVPTLWFIPLTLVVGVVALVWGWLDESAQGTVKRLLTLSGIAGLIYYVAMIIIYNPQPVGLGQVAGIGFWIGLIATIGLLAQTALSRPDAPPRRRPSPVERVSQNAAVQRVWKNESLQRILAFAALVVLFIFFSLSSPNFTRAANIEGIMLATAVNGILAVGVTFVIITGGIDLSIGTVMTLSAVITAKMVSEAGFSIPVGILSGVLTGAAAGFINGIVISRMRVPPFVATLGMLYVAKGLSLILSNLAPIYFPRELNFTETMATGVVIQIPGVIEIPNAVLVMFGAAIVGSFILFRTVLGRYTFALGSNEEATRISGVNTAQWKIAVYTLAGVFSGLAGVMIAARLNSAQPSLGQGYELDAIAAVVIGGTSLSGGEGSILGTVIGAFVISVLTNGLRILSVPQEWQSVVTGAIIIVAVFLDMARRRRS